MLNRGTGTSSAGRAAKQLLTPLTLVRRRSPATSVVFDTYWRFAVERQEILLRRVRGETAPWTQDPILATYKFTNAYRAADRVSQYLIRRVIYSGTYNAHDTVFRILLFKIFNKIETWQVLEESHGEIVASRFDVEEFDRTLNAASSSGAAIYSAAYIMPSGPAAIRQPRKHRMHLELLARLMHDRLPERLLAACSMADAYEVLLSLPGIGPFLAYQFVTDLNYSDHFGFSEMEFVVPGPGARDGMRKCFTDLGDYSEADAIRWVADRQGEEFAARGLTFSSLWGRPLQLIDCQNLFCEVDKYARVLHPKISGYSGRTRIKQKFSANPAPLRPWFPPKWEINERILPSDQPTASYSLL
jgi:alpha-glutamyl/putrescinyl thymine pyrophosphorylase clade 1